MTFLVIPALGNAIINNHGIWGPNVAILKALGMASTGNARSDVDDVCCPIDRIPVCMAFDDVSDVRTMDCLARGAALEINA